MAKKIKIEPKLFINLRVIGALLLVVLIGAIYFYAQGYRISDGFKVSRAGSVKIEIPLSGVEIFIDENRKGKTTENNQMVYYKRISPGVHRILIGKDGYWPWMKNIEVASEKTIHLKPIMMPKDPSGVIITRADSEYQKIQNRIDENFLPSEGRMRVSSDGGVGIYAEGNKIFAVWLGGDNNLPSFFCLEGECNNKIEVLNFKSPLRNLDFYKGQRHAVIFSAEKGVYAIELDRNSVQNFQPIYKGSSENILFAREGENILYIRDGGSLMEIIY